MRNMAPEFRATPGSVTQAKWLPWLQVAHVEGCHLPRERHWGLLLITKAAHCFHARNQDWPGPRLCQGYHRLFLKITRTSPSPGKSVATRYSICGNLKCLRPIGNPC